VYPAGRTYRVTGRRCVCDRDRRVGRCLAGALLVQKQNEKKAEERLAALPARLSPDQAPNGTANPFDVPWKGIRALLRLVGYVDLLPGP
jgi:hypothetical protein